MMGMLTVNQVLGLDTRPGRIGDNVASLVTGTNIDIIAGGAIKSRRAARLRYQLHAQSKGLYARGGVLHAVVPGGHSIQGSAPPGFIYDGIGNGSAFPLSDIQRVVAADTYDVHPQYGPNGYLAIERADDSIEFHWVKEPAVDDSVAVSTKVSLPFKPGPSLVKLNNKIVTIEPTAGNVRFSSSVEGPDDYETVGDAGFLPVSSHVSGNQLVSGVSHHRGRLAALFKDAIQLWRFDEDPSNHAIEQVLNGPGAMLPGSVVNVLGDMFYLSRGGFRNLQTVIITGQSNENEQIGMLIKSLTDLIDEDATAVSLWSQANSQYITFVGTTAYVLTYMPTEKVFGWTTWSLPFSVDYAVELDGVLYVRSGNNVYEFTDAHDKDEGDVTITSTVEFRPFALGKGGRVSELLWLSYQQTGAARWTTIVDGTPLSARLYPTSPNNLRRVPLGGQGRTISFKIVATSAWRLDGFAVEYEPLGV